MKQIDNALQLMQEKGYRITKARQGILEVLFDAKKPLSVQKIQEELSDKGVEANKTTVYRELYFLLDEKVVDEVACGNGSKYYEIRSEHHHHLICVQCKDVEDVFLEHEFKREERRIERQKEFKILHHSLDFFGLCSSCQ